MPQADFSGDFSANSGRSNFPKLKLQTNERARVVVLTKPNVEYVHWLEAPKIINMAPKYSKITDREGNDQWVVDKRFVNRAICHGSFDVLRERGVDEHGCLACQKAREMPDIFRPPAPRYAATIIRYSMRPGGGWNDISNPYAIGSLIWGFSGKIYDKLRSIMTMGPMYEDIRQVDLCLECTDGNYQKPYSQGEFQALAPAFWMVNDQIKQYTIQYLEQNHASNDDLNDAIGKAVKDDWLADDLLRITQAWDVVRAYEARQQGGPALGAGFGAETFQQGMNTVQQQWGPPGQQPAASQFNGGQQAPQTPQVANGGAPQSQVGVDMSLLGGQFAPPPGQQPSYTGPADEAAQVPPASGPQWQPPGQVGDMFAPPAASTPPAPTVPAMAPPAPQQEPSQPTPSQEPGPPQQPPASPSAVPQSPQPIQQQPLVPGQPAPPDGLSGLSEFMASTTTNPSPTPPPPAAGAPAPPADAGAPQPPYSFTDLVKLGQQKTQP